MPQRDCYGRFVGASGVPKPPPPPRPIRRDRRGHFASRATLENERISEVEFIVRGLRVRGEAYRQRALQVQLKAGDPIAEALR